MLCLVGRFTARVLPVLGLLVMAMSAAPSAQADAYFEQGVRLYNQRNFKAAARYFEQSIHNSPWDSSAYYYAALSYHQMSDWNRAKAIYRQTYNKFPGTQAAQLASAALSKIDPDFSKQGSASGVSARASAGSSTRTTTAAAGSDASLPDEARVYFSTRGNSLMIDGELNNRGVKMVFDTGAEACVFGKNHLQQMGITPPTGPATGIARGVGSAGVVKTWTVPVDLKVGTIKRKNFPVLVQEDLPTEPLLGQTFFQSYQYTIDNGARSIHFVKGGGKSRAGGASASRQDNYTVPFIKQGNSLIVNVEVNGKSCPMIFDTGASGTIAFDKKSLGKVGLSIPDDAEEGTSRGIGGETKSYSFSVQRVKFGPIDKSNVQVSVIEQGNIDKPLLGQGFYGDGWQCTVDNDDQVIKFVRR